MTVPYEGATSGAKARDEITKMLKAFGCESVGFMDDFEKHEVLLAFRHRGRGVQLHASAKGWASMWLKKKHQNNRRKLEQKALAQGHIAVYSILRDWVKGQITDVECGIMSFDAVFLPHMLTNDGTRLVERIQAMNVLPPAIEGPRT